MLVYVLLIIGLIFLIKGANFLVDGASSIARRLNISDLVKNNLDIGVVILSSLLLFLFMFTGKKRSLDRWEGVIFLVCYGGYVTYLVFID